MTMRSDAATDDRPSILEDIPLTRPSVPDPGRVAASIEEVLRSGKLTNGDRVRALEESTADYLGVRHCVAVSSCTAGLMLVLRALDVSGNVVLPSFTFAATAHAAAWNGLRPVFADIHPDSLTLSPESAAHAIGVRTSAIIATHIYGTPCDTAALEEIAGERGIRLVFDAAHAFGSLHEGRHVGGFGDAEVFSLSPTKVMVAGEGGLIATDDDSLAERCRIGRDYGNPGDYDCVFVGLNARMSELHAVLASASLDRLDERIERRNALATMYVERLGDIAGIGFPSSGADDRSTFKDFTILVEPGEFRTDADGLAASLHAVGIDSRRYYSPPVHRMKAYRNNGAKDVRLPVTEWAADRVLTLPMWSEMRADDVVRVTDAVRRVHRTAAPT